MKKERLLWPDIVKAVAMVCIILGHTGLSYVCSVVQIFHVPIFFFISGYFYKNIELKKSIRTSFNRNLIPYIFVICFLMISNMVANIVDCVFADGPFQAGEIALGWVGAAGLSQTSDTWVGEIRIFSVGAAWFLPAFFVAHCIKSVISNTKYEGVLAVLVAVTGFVLSRFFYLPLHIETAMICVVFMSCGSFAREKNLLVDKKVRKLLPVFGLVFAGVIVRNLQTNSWVDYASCTFRLGFVGDILASLCGIFFVILFIQILSERRTALFKWIAWYGQNTMVVLCFHTVEGSLINWKWFFRYGFIVGGGVAMLLKLVSSVLAICVVHHSKVLRKIFS